MENERKVSSWNIIFKREMVTAISLVHYSASNRFALVLFTYPIKIHSLSPLNMLIVDMF